ncbi:MAG: glycosyl hydrolase 115 family protein [Bacteroidaceae bacterium]|nr:glycosyl hydrolase 115 family protein [Bacteroidaceae bacterium]
MKHLILSIVLLVVAKSLYATEQFVLFNKTDNCTSLCNDISIIIDENDNEGVKIAAKSLQNDIFNVTNRKPVINGEKGNIIIGTIGHSKLIDNAIKKGIIKRNELKDKWEKYIITTYNGQLFIAGSDRRGTIFGIYEFSRQLGVSPWYWWADVPVEKHNEIYIKNGIYTDGEPKVKYRGIFINDENPCMQQWAREKFGGMNSKMYVHVYELILRLKGNILWPGMWGSFKEYRPLETILKDENGNWEGNDFNDDDPLNPKLANDYGVVIGTSHHEPMQRSQQEWLRRRENYGNGEWNYMTNRDALQRFFKEGIENTKDYECMITMGMRGDEDRPMVDAGSREENMKLLRTIFDDQRRIIKEVTGKPAEEMPQVWTLYSELLDYYNDGFKIPDDITLMLCDDNWGDIRKVPTTDLKRKGGYGMYYHLGYYGGPRAYKWIQHSQIQKIWEQMQFAYDYGIDRLWMINVGDIKPDEFPLSFLMDMAWDPTKFNENNLMDYTREFCRQNFGEEYADEAARILNEDCKLASIRTAEMLDDRTYNLQTGEFESIRNRFLALETMALRLYNEMDSSKHDAYQQIILFPVQALANLYDMYYSLAMNRKLAKENDIRANEWADRVDRCYERDSILCWNYNHKMSGGKWNHMMDEVHIGYTSWHCPQFQIKPTTLRVSSENAKQGGYVFNEHKGSIIIEAEHYYRATATKDTRWTIIPDLGRTLSGMALMPYTKPAKGAMLEYKVKFNEPTDKVKVKLVFATIMPFVDGGHYVEVGFKDCNKETRMLNKDFNWQHCYDKMYPAGAERVIEITMDLKAQPQSDGYYILQVAPQQPGIVLEKICINNQERTFFNGNETPYIKE